MSEPKELSPSFEPSTQDASDLPDGWLQVQSLDLDAQGVARKPDGKVIFIDGALPFELVTANTHRKKNNWEQASLTAIHRESSQRVRPGCPHFGLHAGACGGCKMQHLHMGAQVAVKQRVLEDNLWHLGKVKAQTMLRPIEGPSWGYRYRARLSVRHVIKKGQVLIGFHERKSRYVADMQQCPVLPPHVDAMLMPLRALIAGMDARDTCPQIELACGDSVTALVLMVGAVINVFVGSSAGMMAISVAAIGIFSAYMLYDLKQILDGGETNYISATLALYLDIFNVFQSLLALLGIAGGERD